MTRIGSAASEAPFGLVAPDALVKTNEGSGPRWVDVIETNPRHRRDRGLSALGLRRCLGQDRYQAETALQRCDPADLYRGRAGSDRHTSRAPRNAR